jgi:hypothetical protein
MSLTYSMISVQPDMILLNKVSLQLTPTKTMKTNYSRLLMALVSSVSMATTVGLSAQPGMSASGYCRIKYNVYLVDDPYYSNSYIEILGKGETVEYIRMMNDGIWVKVRASDYQTGFISIDSIDCR